MHTSLFHYSMDISPAQLLQRLRDPEALARRILPGSTLLEHVPREDGVIIRTLTEIPLEWLPGVVRERAGERFSAPTVERTEDWWRDGEGLSGRMEFAFTGVDAEADCTMRAEPAGAGTDLAVTVRLGVRVFLVGGLIEKAVATQIDASLAQEAAAIGTP